MPAVTNVRKSWVVWTSELSPFGLKLMLLCRYHALPFRVLPEQGTTAERIRYSLRRERLTRGLLALTWPRMTAEDEFPLVPFLFGPDGENLYDSTALAEWLDRRTAPDRRLLPELPLAHFLAALIDDPSLRAAMGARNAEKVRAAYTWDRVADAYLAVYRRAAARGSRGNASSQKRAAVPGSARRRGRTGPARGWPSR